MSPYRNMREIIFAAANRHLERVGRSWRWGQFPAHVHHADPQP